MAQKALQYIAHKLSLLDFSRVRPILEKESRRQAPSSFQDQLAVAAFSRTLMQASVALEDLLTGHPDVIRRSKPFGLNIGFEAFTLANHPMMSASRPGYSRLRMLVTSFKRQYAELGIDPSMVRRRPSVVAAVRDVNVPSPAEVELENWLKGWLAGIPSSSPSLERSVTDKLVMELLADQDGSRTSRERLLLLLLLLWPAASTSTIVADIFGPCLTRTMTFLWQAEKKKKIERGEGYTPPTWEDFLQLFDNEARKTYERSNEEEGYINAAHQGRESQWRDFTGCFGIATPVQEDVDEFLRGLRGFEERERRMSEAFDVI